MSWLQLTFEGAGGAAMGAPDKLLGGLLMTASVAIFAYYTLWVLVTPFIDRTYFLQAYFPDRAFAIMIPVVLLVLVLTATGAFLALVMIKSRKPKAKVA